MFPRLLVPSMETITATVATTTTEINSSSSENAAARVPPTDDSISFLSDDEWWINAIEEDSFDDNEFNLWNRSFVPPPPRPPFLNESITSDGLSTCDLCTWALHERNLHTLEGSLEAAGELGWAFTLIIVSVISALIGAIVMVIVLRCRRLKSGNNNGGRPVSLWCRNNETSRNVTTKHTADRIRRPTSNSGVWTWLNIQQPSSGPDLIDVQSPLPAENRYSQINDPYNPVGVDEALYAELDTESVQSNNPPFKTSHIENVDHNQDTVMICSVPSSAYYSDLSLTTVPSGGNDRAYEIVDLNVTSTSLPLPHWDAAGDSSGSSGGGLTVARRTPKLAAINESTTTMPSDYV